MSAGLNFEHALGPYAGWIDRTPLEILQTMAGYGQPDALEILRNIPHHGERVGRSPAEKIAINAQIRVVVTRICTMQDLETQI
jgi:hypothetical protein